MKRYLLFCNEEYYPEGGMNDFAGSFGSVEEAKESAGSKLDWAHIYDIKEERLVCRAVNEDIWKDKSNWKASAFKKSGWKWEDI